MINRIDLSIDIQLPLNKWSIAMIGAGSIVEDAHLPAYKKAGWPVVGIYDINIEKAKKLAKKFNIQNVCTSPVELAAHASPQCAFDIAVPATHIAGILRSLPDGAIVMMQKPMGETLEQAKEILDICERKNLIASVNFQMKLIPSIIAAKSLIDQGAIGDLHDMEIRMNIHHPWELWDFLFELPRMEMLYHSIHYMDMIRYFLGMPEKVYAKTFQHPKQIQLASTRSVIIFDYNKPVRAFVNTNHGHDYGLKHQDSFVKWEGTNGAIKVTLGKNINFPKGEIDSFEYYLNDDPTKGWQTVDIAGKWYPDAFIATMADLLCAAENTNTPHVTAIKYGFQTMQLVEAAYHSNDHGGTTLHLARTKS